MEQSKRDAAVAVITEAFNTAHESTPDYPDLEKTHRHDGHQFYFACDVCHGDVAKLAPHIVDALAAAGLLASTSEVAAELDDLRSRMQTIRAIHRNDVSGSVAPVPPGMCEVCMHEWPCPTILAVDRHRQGSDTPC